MSDEVVKLDFQPFDHDDKMRLASIFQEFAGHPVIKAYKRIISLQMSNRIQRLVNNEGLTKDQCMIMAAEIRTQKKMHNLPETYIKMKVDYEKRKETIRKSK